MRILVAMSGGVDSSVVAHILHEQGHELIGVRFTLWSDPLAPAMAQVLPSKCCNTQTASRARTVAADLKIPLEILNLEEDFKREVVDRFLEEHRHGRTLNPCINCNRTVKFGKLIELAQELGCEKLATGHYARIASETLPDGTQRRLLLEATDSSKDQSYYLYGLNQEQLQHVAFPLGTMVKRDVFALAERYGVPYDAETYKESQDLCFFPEKEPRAFLQRHLKDAMSPGDIVRRDGTVVGQHQGLPLYTIGQRRIGVGGLQVPLEVVAKNIEQNQLVVAEQGSEYVGSVPLTDVRWVSWQPEDGMRFECRTRSLSSRHSGIFRSESGTFSFQFDSQQPPQGPGQSLVLYRGEEVVGGGVMS